MTGKNVISLSLALCAAALLGGCPPPAPSDGVRLGVQASEDGLWDEAAARWAKVLEADPSSAAAHNNLAVACEKNGRFEEARREYEAALSLDPENDAIRQNVLMFRRSRGWPPNGGARKKGPPRYSAAARRVVIKIPAVPPAGMRNYKQIIVTDFQEIEPVPDLDLGRETADGLALEMRRVFQGTVSRRALRRNPGAAAAGAKFWKSAGAGLEDAAFFTGAVGLREEVQKALQETDLPRDGPFKLENHGLLERKQFTLKIIGVLIDAASGALVGQKTVTVTRTYRDIEQSAEFGLAGLLPAVSAGLFPAFFGQEALTERYLLVR